MKVLFTRTGFAASENLVRTRRKLNQVPLTEVDNIDADKKARRPAATLKGSILKKGSISVL